jgi:hypothetical protein
MKFKKIGISAAAALVTVAIGATSAIAATPSYNFTAHSSVGTVKGNITVDVSKQQICYTIKSSTVKNLKSIQLWAHSQKTMNFKVSAIGSSMPTCVKLADPEAPTDVTGSTSTAYIKFTTKSGKTLKARLKKV